MTRREVFAILASALALPGLLRTVHVPSMRVESEMKPIAADYAGPRYLPTGRRFYEVDGRRVSENEFFAVAATHPISRMRDWARAWREARQ